MRYGYKNTPGIAGKPVVIRAKGEGILPLLYLKGDEGWKIVKGGIADWGS